MQLGMREPLRRPALTVALPLILIGLAGTAVAISDRSADSSFVYRQQHLVAIQPGAVAHLMSLADDPRPNLGHTRATSASCVAHGNGELRNPWFCVVQYARGAPVHYRATISASGSLSANDPTGQLTVHGCCLGSDAAQQ